MTKKLTRDVEFQRNKRGYLIWLLKTTLKKSFPLLLSSESMLVDKLAVYTSLIADTTEASSIS